MNHLVNGYIFSFSYKFYKVSLLLVFCVPSKPFPVMGKAMSHIFFKLQTHIYKRNNITVSALACQCQDISVRVNYNSIFFLSYINFFYEAVTLPRHREVDFFRLAQKMWRLIKFLSCFCQKMEIFH